MKPPFWYVWMVMLIWAPRTPASSRKAKNDVTANEIPQRRRFLQDSFETFPSLDPFNFTATGASYHGGPPPKIAPELKKAAEKNLLSLIGLSKRPEIPKNVKPPLFMIQMFERQRRHVENLEMASVFANSSEPEVEDDRAFSNSVRSFSLTDVQSVVKNNITEAQVFFDIAGIPEEEHLNNAELRLVHIALHETSVVNDTLDSSGENNKNRIWSPEDEPYLQRITVFDTLRPTTRSNKYPSLMILDTCVIDTRTSGSVKLDVISAVKRWQKIPKNNYGLVVEVKPYNKNKSKTSSNHVRLRRDVSSLETWLQERPNLLTYADDQHTVRTKRSVKTYPPRNRKPNPLCARYKMTVDFRMVGWDDWLIAPPGYEAYFCKGECPYPIAEHLSPTNHAVVQNLVHATYPNRVPPACCVPTEFSPLSLLYLDTENQGVLKTYQKMVVERCGCR